MNKIICDICEERVADEHFRVQKQIKTVGFFDYGLVFPKNEWVPIDICEECYQKLFFKSSVEEENNKND